MGQTNNFRERTSFKLAGKKKLGQSCLERFAFEHIAYFSDLESAKAQIEKFTFFISSLWLM